MRRHWKTSIAPNQAFQATLDSAPERTRCATKGRANTRCHSAHIVIHCPHDVVRLE